VVADGSGGLAQLVEVRLVIERLRNLGLTFDAVSRRCVRKKVTNSIFGLSSQPVVVTQPNKRLQTETFCVGVVWQTRSIMVYTREEDCWWLFGKGIFPLILVETC